MENEDNGKNAQPEIKIIVENNPDTNDNKSNNINEPVKVEIKGRKRNKVPLKPGFSLYDWMQIVNSKQDLSGGKKSHLTLQEVRKHNRYPLNLLLL